MRQFCRDALALAGAVGFAGLVVGCARPRLEPTVAQPAPLPEAHARMGPTMQAPSAQWIAKQYRDLPVPEDFRLLSDESFVFIQGAVRKADLNYEGALPVRDVIRFYQESMPISGWQFLRMTGVTMKTLTYFKGNEMVEIVIETHAPHDEHTNEPEHEQQFLTHLHIQLG